MIDSLVKIDSSELKILDIDMETRKIGFHQAGRYKPEGCEPVIVATSWVGEDEVKTFSLTNTWKEKDMRNILENFVSLYNEADIVTGHFISGFDLPIINGALMEFGYEPLGKKMIIDTKTGLKSVAGLSQSQENLSALNELDASKFHMNDYMWRQVTRLLPEGLKLASERVVTDVQQHKLLYKALSSWLEPPIYWT